MVAQLLISALRGKFSTGIHSAIFKRCDSEYANLEKKKNIRR